MDLFAWLEALHDPVLSLKRLGSEESAALQRSLACFLSLKKVPFCFNTYTLGGSPRDNTLLLETEFCQTILYVEKN